MTLVLTEQQQQQLQQLARATQRSEQDLATEAIDRFLDYEQHFVASVEEGLAAGERGELHTHEEVKARIAKLLAAQ